MRRVRALAMIAGLAVAAAVGAFAGVALGERASERGIDEVVIADPALAPDEFDALRSAGGFTGFEGAPALSGRVVRVGGFEVASTEHVRVVHDGAAMEITLHEPGRLFHLGPASAPLAPGDLVLVRYEGEDVAGVLRVPSGIE